MDLSTCQPFKNSINKTGQKLDTCIMLLKPNRKTTPAAK